MHDAVAILATEHKFVIVPFDVRSRANRVFKIELLVRRWTLRKVDCVQSLFVNVNEAKTVPGLLPKRPDIAEFSSAYFSGMGYAGMLLRLSQPAPKVEVRLCDLVPFYFGHGIRPWVGDIAGCLLQPLEMYCCRCDC